LKRSCIALFFSLSLVFTANAQTDLIDSLYNMSADFARKDIVKQKEFLYSGITVCKQRNSPKLTNFYAMLMVSHQSAGSMDSARYYVDLLEKASTNDENSLLNYHQTSGLFYKNQGKSKDALPHMLQALALTKDSTNSAGQMLNIGNTYIELGDINAAAKWHLKSLALFEKVGNKKGESFAYNSLGGDYLKMEQWEKSEVYYEKSLKLKEELKDKRGIITSLGGIGNVKMEAGDYPAALKAFERALEMSKEMKTTTDVGRSYHELAQVYGKMGDKEKSKSYYKEALIYAKQANDKPWAAWIESNILKLEEHKRSKESMEAGLLKTLQQFEEGGDRIGVANSLENLSGFYSDHSEYEKAYKNLRRSKNLNDSSRGMGVDEQLRDLEERYANEKRDREMALLRKDQDLKTADLERKHAVQAGIIIALISLLIIGGLLVNRYQVISRSRRHREIETVRNAIARDLHDDIGSTLSSINILSQLAIGEGNDGAVKHFNKIAEQSSRMMESMSDIVWSISPGNDSLEHVVSKMKEFAAEILEPKNITYRFTGDESLKNTTLSLDKRKNLYLIFKEAVNNAAKYSGATDLEITFIRQGNTLSLSVSDNGGGFEPETVKAGNGLKNMKERARALSARFDFVTRVKEGTRVALELPLT
jgi:two-component system sensor histidine kinase UhpB